jgi:hypothetical protein
MEKSPQYFNDSSIELEPSPWRYYGKKHFSEQGQPIKGMVESHYPPMESPKWAVNRKRYNPLTHQASSIEPHTNWPAPAGDDYWNVLMAVRKYITVGFRDNTHDCLADRKNILVNLLGFEDTGVSINGDLQFIYQYSSEHSQIEIYLSTGEYAGNPTELNRYSFSRNVEVRLPCDDSFEVLRYIFFQVWGDSYQCNFNKVELTQKDSKTYRSIENTDDIRPEDSFQTEGFINHILNGGFILDYEEPEMSNEQPETTNVEPEMTSDELFEHLELALQGEVLAQRNLGHMYAVEGDYENAHYWLEEAGKQDDFESIYALAILYKSGKGVPKSIEASYQLLTIAAKGGYVEAQQTLREWEEEANNN